MLHFPLLDNAPTEAQFYRRVMELFNGQKSGYVGRMHANAPGDFEMQWPDLSAYDADIEFQYSAIMQALDLASVYAENGKSTTQGRIGRKPPSARAVVTLGLNLAQHAKYDFTLLDAATRSIFPRGSHTGEVLGTDKGWEFGITQLRLFVGRDPFYIALIRDALGLDPSTSPFTLDKLKVQLSSETVTITEKVDARETCPACSIILEFRFFRYLLESQYGHRAQARQTLQEDEEDETMSHLARQALQHSNAFDIAKHMGLSLDEIREKLERLTKIKYIKQAAVWVKFHDKTTLIMLPLRGHNDGKGQPTPLGLTGQLG